MSSEFGQVCSPQPVTGRAFAGAAHHGAGGAVAEQRGGDDVALTAVAVAEGQPAQLDHQKQVAVFSLGAGLSGSTGQANHAAGAAEPEDRQPLQVAAHAQPFHQQRIERRCRNAGARDEHETVDVGDLELKPSAGTSVPPGRAGPPRCR